MGPAKGIRVLVLIITGGLLASSIGLVGSASAYTFTRAWVSAPVGSGSAGSGSLAVAAFFDVKTSSGAGAFSGNLAVPSGPQSGLFSLRFTLFLSDLSCPAGQVSASGSVTSGSFQGEQVLVAGCIGTGLTTVFAIYHDTPSNAFFSGRGPGTAMVSSSPIKGGIAVAGVTSGSGSAGSGTIYTAEADGITEAGLLVGGGAFTGTVTSDVTGVWLTKHAQVTGCTLTTSGVTGSFGSFPNQPVSSTYTLITCPPASLGPQTSRFVYVVGGETNPIYKGSGLATFWIIKLEDVPV